MQILPETDVAELLDRLVEDEVPGRRGFGPSPSGNQGILATLIKK